MYTPTVKLAVFQKDPDHTCLQFYHEKKISGEKEKEKEEKKRASAANLISYLVQQNKLSSLSLKKQGDPGMVL